MKSVYCITNCSLASTHPQQNGAVESEAADNPHGNECPNAELFENLFLNGENNTVKRSERIETYQNLRSCYLRIQKCNADMSLWRIQQGRWLLGNTQRDTIQNILVHHQSGHLRLVSTDNELITERNVNLAAMQSSASGSNVRYYPTWKHSPLKEINEQGCYKLPDVCS
jgi:hypothetical protein